MKSNRKLDDLDLSRTFECTVLRNERLTPEGADEIRELRLLGPQALAIGVGQSVGVLAPGDAAFGQDLHLRLYSVSDVPERSVGGETAIKITVKRCFYVDDFSGERYPGRASNYLCDLQPGATLRLAGPFGLAFEVPKEPDANLILIATSTGIAPFRAFVRHLFEQETSFEGKIRLLYGGRQGVDLVFLNESRNDFAKYYDNNTFAAFQALSNRPHWSDEIDWHAALHGDAAELRLLLEHPRTYVYIAGLERHHAGLMQALSNLAGDQALLERRRREMAAGGRWVELLY